MRIASVITHHDGIRLSRSAQASSIETLDALDRQRALHRRALATAWPSTHPSSRPFRETGPTPSIVALADTPDTPSIVTLGGPAPAGEDGCGETLHTDGDPRRRSRPGRLFPPCPRASTGRHASTGWHAGAGRHASGRGAGCPAARPQRSRHAGQAKGAEATGGATGRGGSGGAKIRSRIRRRTLCR